MANKPALGTSFDLKSMLTGAPAVPPLPEPVAEPAARAKEAARPGAPVVLDHLSAQVPAALLEEARREVHSTPGLNLSALVTEALAEHLARRQAARSRAPIPNGAAPSEPAVGERLPTGPSPARKEGRRKVVLVRRLY
jgi:hypothetical protein